MLKPKIVKLKSGDTVSLFYISELANSIGRTSQCVRKWEVSGVIPITPFKDKAGKRLYSQEHIDAIAESAEKCRISQGRSIANTSFKDKVHRLFNEINKKYL